ncbi:MAG: heavy-metal-associated domain-containing protein [Anaerolineae bacterium]|nr:heavy-metal-associated domain-containing protein [Anaerolineae bacterium]
MKTTTIELPMMYGDHHVVAVRKLLEALPGVETIYASSSFHVVEIQYDETQLNEETIRDKLDAGSYLGELILPIETGTAAAEQNGQKAFFRHTAVLEQVGETVRFAQTIPSQQRPLWPCPGIDHPVLEK